MSDSRLTILGEKHQPNRFGTPRFGAVLASRQQAAAVREAASNEQGVEIVPPGTPLPVDPAVQAVNDKFNV